MKRYEEADFDRDALIDRYNGPGTIRVTLDADSYALHHEYAMKYASRNKPKKAFLFLQLEGALKDADKVRLAEGKAPLRRLKRRAFEKMIDRLDPFFVCLGREGREVALRKWGILTTGLDVEKPFERLEMDEWRVSLMTLMVDAGVWEMLDEKKKIAVKRKRVWLSVAIDARTRMIVAMRFLDSDPCIESALATIELAMRDKSRIAEHVGASPTYIHAKPRSIAMDNGSNYTANDVMARIVRLGISAHYPPAGLAEMRARIERLFGTLKTKIVSHFTGQTFSNILEKGDYDSSANASLNVEELNRCFLRGVLDLYHHHPHEGLLNETPYQCMLRLSKEYGLPLPPDRDVLRHVMGVSCQRRIGDAGVRVLGIRYQSKALQLFRREARQKPIEIRVDRFDLSSISVKTSRGWIVCNARYKGLEGVSLWQWTEAIRDLRRRNVDLAAASRHFVIDAVRNLSNAAAEAVKRAEIKNPIVNAGTFQTLEGTLFRGLTFADDGEWGDELVLSDGTLPAPDLVMANQSNGPVSQDTENTQSPQDDLYLTDHGFGSESEWTSN
ncbi:Mu transposase C-terminal domain-containing protein [Bradyrhizobium sp. SYSU BS000235]|uniref:Mu transposase C-terminal domain-containing protein n=1 Tax=Bradyrhizobium sp. SYSU BS000235 TaxID=3411332 RepID=UPI003C711FEC